MLDRRCPGGERRVGSFDPSQCRNFHLRVSRLARLDHLMEHRGWGCQPSRGERGPGRRGDARAGLPDVRRVAVDIGARTHALPGRAWCARERRRAALDSAPAPVRRGGAGSLAPSCRCPPDEVRRRLAGATSRFCGVLWQPVPDAARLWGCTAPTCERSFDAPFAHTEGHPGWQAGVELENAPCRQCRERQEGPEGVRNGGDQNDDLKGHGPVEKGVHRAVFKAHFQ